MHRLKFPILAVILSFSTSLFLHAQDIKVEDSIIDAVQFFDDGDFRAASNLLRRELQVNPDNDAARYYLGMTEFSLGNADEAEMNLLYAVELDGNNFWYRYHLAKLYSLTNRVDKAVGIYRQLLSDFPKKDDIYFDLVELYIASEKYDEAIDVLDKIETSFGKNESTVRVRMNIMSAQGKQQEAYEYLETFNREYSSPWALSVLGDYEMSMYNDSTALACYDEALDLESSYPPALLGKAEVFRLTRKYDDYFNILDTIAINSEVFSQSKSEYLRTIVNRLDPKFIKSNTAQFDNVMDACVDTHPEDSSILITAGLYYFKTGRQDKSVDMFAKNAALYPDEAAPMAGYLQVLMLAGKWESASKESRIAAERFPDEPGFLDMASAADYNLGDYGSVLEMSEKILAMAMDAGDSPRIVSAYSTMGDMYHLLGQQDKAFSAYDKALKINPEYAPVLNNYAYYLSLLGVKLKKAAAMSRITVTKEPDNATYLDTYGWILYLQGKYDEAKPYFKHAMIYGGKESAVVLDHYAEVLYKLGEFDLAFLYWNQAKSKNVDGKEEKIIGLEEKISARKAAAGKK